LRIVGRSMSSETWPKFCALLDPRAIEALQRLDRVGRVIVHALEQRDAAVLGHDLLVVDVEVRAGVVLVDLRDQQLAHRELERLLHLAQADEVELAATLSSSHRPAKKCDFAEARPPWAPL
jgi:hypothetical protein